MAAFRRAHSAPGRPPPPGGDFRPFSPSVRSGIGRAGWHRWAAIPLYGLPVVFLVLFFFYPLVKILGLSLTAAGRLDLTPFATLIQEPYYRRLLGITTGQALLSTLLTLLAGMPAAFVFAHYDFRGRALLRALTTIPFVMPTMVVAAAFLALLGPGGLLNQGVMAVLDLSVPPLRLQHTLALVLLAHVFYNATIVVRMVGGFWANLDPRIEEAARALGAGRWRTFREVTLPILLPAIAAASLLVFLFCFTSFGVILILGGPSWATVEVEIFYQAVPLFDLPLAAALSIGQMVFTFAIMALYTRIQARAAVPLNLRPARERQRPLATWRARFVVGASIGGLMLLLLAPLLALVHRSFSLGGGLPGAETQGYTLRYYSALFTNPTQSYFFVPPAEAIRNSILVATGTVVLSLLVGLASAYSLVGGSPALRKSRTGRIAAGVHARKTGPAAGRRTPRGTSQVGLVEDGGGKPLSGGTRGWRPAVALRTILDPLFMLPLGTSAVTLGLGYIVALDRPPLDLRTSPALLPLAHSLVAFPFVVRSLLPALRGMNPHWREAAGVLGASPPRVAWEIDLPVVGRALLVGAVFAFTVSMGEFGASLLIVRPAFPTMPVVIYRLLGAQGMLNQGQGLAMSTLLMLVAGVSFLLIERFRVGEMGEF